MINLLQQPTLDDILAARQRISTYVTPTPLIESNILNEQVGGRLLIKAEVLQKTGAFKYRGACNFLSQLNEEQRKNGVVAYSSGNHAQAVAAAAAFFKIPSVIVMPADAPIVKIEKTKSYGAEVVLYDRYTQSREEIATAIAQEKGAVIVPPYEHPHTIAGQGTLALEMLDQAKELGANMDFLLIPCSGGGLTAGCSLVFKNLSPQTRVYAVEPEAYDDTRQSLQTGKRIRLKPDQTTICDALMMPEPGELTFTINSQTLSGGLTVSDDEVRHAMRLVFDCLKLVVEPGGAVALAAVLSHKLEVGNKTVGLILSGGNVDSPTFCQALTSL